MSKIEKGMSVRASKGMLTRAAKQQDEDREAGLLLSFDFSQPSPIPPRYPGRPIVEPPRVLTQEERKATLRILGVSAREWMPEWSYLPEWPNCSVEALRENERARYASLRDYTRNAWQERDDACLAGLR